MFVLGFRYEFVITIAACSLGIDHFQVKAFYNLTIDTAEKSKLTSILSGC